MPVNGPYRPATQLRQVVTVSAAAVYVPAAHSAGKALLGLHTLPAGQSLQIEAPATSLYLPVAQAWQFPELVAPVPVRNLPAAQGVGEALQSPPGQ